MMLILWMVAFVSQRKTSKPALTLMIAVLNQWPDIAAQRIKERHSLKLFLMSVKPVQYKLAGLSKPAIQNVPGLRLYSTHLDALSLLSAKVFAERMFTFP
ncbi:hypothetical protein MMB10_18555 [Salmonella enterica]|nr:hypothetical protein [Salmonella enterica]